MKKHASFLLLCLSTVTVLPQYGLPDLNFDGDGTAILKINDSSSVVYAMEVQDDNKILVAGVAYNGQNMDFAMARFFPDGSPDLSFGEDGIVLTDFFENNDIVTSMVLQPDGRIILGGSANNNLTFALARCNTDGSLDNTFSNDGKVTAGFGFKDDHGPEVLLQSDGRIILAGSDFHDGGYYCSIVRYNTDGSVDNSFAFDENALEALINGAVLQSDGKILVCGQITASPGVDLLLARFNADGSVDNTFSFDGKVTFDYQYFDIGVNVVEGRDGKLIVGGYFFGAYPGPELLRYSSDGLIDETFNGSGYFVYTDENVNSHYTFAVQEQSDNKILIAGSGYRPLSGFGFEIFRLGEDGSLDTTFGDGGIVYNSVYLSSGCWIYAIKLQSDGKILAAGHSYEPQKTYYNMTVMRFSSGLPAVLDTEIADEVPFSIYPNPFSESFTVDCPGMNGNSLLEIYTADGRKVLSVKPAGTTETIDGTSLPDGLYLLRIVDDRGSSARQIVRKN